MKTEAKEYKTAKRQKGYRNIMLWLTEADYNTIFRAAAAEHRRATELMLHYGLAAAKKILEKNPLT